MAALENKRVVVIGGSSGIGLVVARQAVEAGAEVVIASRHPGNLEAASQVLAGRVTTAPLDVTSERATANFFRNIGEFDHLAVTVKPKLPSGRIEDTDTPTAPWLWTSNSGPISCSPVGCPIHRDR